MSISADGLYQYGGVPVGQNNYGMWGGKTWFVDYDHGTTGGVGDRPDSAQKHLQTILSKATAWDVIYIRPRDPDYAGGDPNTIIPASTANFTTSYTQYGLALIGTGIGASRSKAYQTRLSGSSTVQATAGLTMAMPFGCLENLSFKRGGSTKCAVDINALASSSGYAFGGTVYNCLFWKVGATALEGALSVDSAWHTNILNTDFMECAVGVNIQNSNSLPYGIVVRGCVFDGTTGTVDADIWSDSHVYEICIKDCFFNHEIPTLGSPAGANRYVKIGTSSTGNINNCGFATATNTITSSVTVGSGVLLVNCWYAPGTNLTDGT